MNDNCVGHVRDLVPEKKYVANIEVKDGTLTVTHKTLEPCDREPRAYVTDIRVNEEGQLEVEFSGKDWEGEKVALLQQIAETAMKGIKDAS